MKTYNFSFVIADSVAVLGASLPVFAADKPSKPAGLKFRVQQLRMDNNEGCAIADFNEDGKLDISAGEFWYPGPDFKEKKPLPGVSMGLAVLFNIPRSFVCPRATGSG